MKDYVDIWTRWVGFLQSDLTTRKEVLEGLNLEVRAGFDVITKISLEELEYKLADSEYFKILRNDLNTTLAFCVWCGYTLFLVSEGVDPVQDNLIIKQETNELGNTWMENYEKDKTASLLININPILSLFMQNISQNEFNQLVALNPATSQISYQDFLQILSYLQWATHQGFVLGVIEQTLIKIKNKDNKT